MIIPTFCARGLKLFEWMYASAAEGAANPRAWKVVEWLSKPASMLPFDSGNLLEPLPVDGAIGALLSETD